jgi:hypothetical protein
MKKKNKAAHGGRRGEPNPDGQTALTATPYSVTIFQLQTYFTYYSMRGKDGGKEVKSMS